MTWPALAKRNGYVQEPVVNTTITKQQRFVLGKDLPDIITELNNAVVLPELPSWQMKEEGRLSNELDELQVFFNRTKYPKGSPFILIKMVNDYVNDLGIDGFRVDTPKHVRRNPGRDSTARLPCLQYMEKETS